MRKLNFEIRWICLVAVFMALTVVLSSFGIPVPGGHFYFNDVVICLASLFLDPLGAFLVGGIGAFLGDFFFYPAPMFVSLITHGLQAITISLFSNYVLKKRPVLSAILGCIIGSLIEVLGYSLGRAFIYSTPEYALLKLPFQFLQAGLGSFIALMLGFKGHFVRVGRNFLSLQRNQ